MGALASQAPVPFINKLQYAYKMSFNNNNKRTRLTRMSKSKCTKAGHETPPNPPSPHTKQKQKQKKQRVEKKGGTCTPDQGSGATLYQYVNASNPYKADRNN